VIFCRQQYIQFEPTPFNLSVQFISSRVNPEVWARYPPYAATGSLNANQGDKTRKMLEVIDSGKHIWILWREILPSAKDLAKEYQKLFKEILGALPL